jgi:AcrR family transcriptional regulator
VARVPSKPVARPRRAPVKGGAQRPEDNRDLRAMIMAATEQLLAEKRLEEITVLDVIECAGVSRASFYIYFESKYAPLAALAEEVADKLYNVYWAEYLAGDESPTPEAYTNHWRQTVAVWSEHRAVLVAAAAAWRADPSAIEGWATLWNRYVGDNEAFIERARTRGEAPPGLNARALAASLCWMSENALYLAFTDAAPEFHDHERLAQVQSMIWHRAIFGASTAL